MDLPRFFDKSALAAAQVLSNFNYEKFQQFLCTVLIEVSFDSAAANSCEGKKTLDLLVRLLARLYPRLVILPLDAGCDTLLQDLSSLARAINPSIQLLPSDAPTLSIVIGKTIPRHSAVKVYIGSDGWVCKFSPRSPVGSGDSSVPFGAGAAACLATANAFRHVFKDQLFEPGFDSECEWSLFDYEKSKGANPTIPPGRDLGRIHLVGLGAIGNGALWALLNSNFTGDLELIDPEEIALSNLQRYVMALDSHEHQSKAKIAQQMLEQKGYRVNAHSENWGDYLGRSQDWNLRTVAVSVDSAKTRYEIQGALPLWIVNAWTQPLNVGVSRHTFVGEHACLMCLYSPTQEVPSEDAQIANAIGFNAEPQKILEVRVRLFKNIPIDQPFLLRVAAAKGIPVEPLLPFVGKTLREFYSRAVCGGLVFSLNPLSTDPGQPVPIAFQSAMAGLMLAAEITKHCLNLLAFPPPVTTTVNLLKPIGSHFSLSDKKVAGHCICKDQDFLAAFENRWFK